jgi:hypothetical protein
MTPPMSEDDHVIEINKVALDAVGIQLSDVEGRPFWTTFCWQVSEPINQTLRASIARAASGSPSPAMASRKIGARAAPLAFTTT